MTLLSGWNVKDTAWSKQVSLKMAATCPPAPPQSPGVQVKKSERKKEKKKKKKKKKERKKEKLRKWFCHKNALLNCFSFFNSLIASARVISGTVLHKAPPSVTADPRFIPRPPWTCFEKATSFNQLYIRSSSARFQIRQQKATTTRTSITVKIRLSGILHLKFLFTHVSYELRNRNIM